MESKNFSCTISVNMSADQVMDRISKVPDWWGVTFSGHAEKQGDMFLVKMGGDSFFDMMVSELVPSQKVVWLVKDCYMPWYADKKEWLGNKLIFDISENNWVTKLTFMHEGLIPGIECYKDCYTGWTHWITRSLYSYITTGKGDFKQR